ncbi:MAG: DNA polymerase III subunit delta' C-terminal domain-containing protein [Phycisphaerae bacterium]|jgi:DNA polymerase-3 subunit delta'|nr:DNA polymerase III subunit delta' C-terminal domain-containing protein [Phycisphaerae bacterium]
MVKLLDIIGQDPAVALLQRRIATGRMGHALMFTGPHGVGRRTTALALAGALLCESPQKIPNNGEISELDDNFELTDACGQCNDCKTLTAGTHPDLGVIAKELAAHHPAPEVRNRKMQNLGIGVIKHFLLKSAYLAPARGKGKVFIVREAELMTPIAQNALLKTLEEPPPGVTIILLCRRSEQMLPTTISRCHTVQFGPLPSDFVTDRLAREEIDPDEAKFWAAFTDGSVGRALSLARSDMYAVKCDMLDELAALGPGGDAGLGERLQKITEARAIAAVKAAKSADKAELSKMLATRQATGTMLELIASAFRDAISLAAGADRPLVNADQHGAVESIARKHSMRQLTGAIEQLSNYEQLLWRNVSPKIVWDNVVLACAAG